MTVIEWNWLNDSNDDFKPKSKFLVKWFRLILPRLLVIDLAFLLIRPYVQLLELSFQIMPNDDRSNAKDGKETGQDAPFSIRSVEIPRLNHVNSIRVG